MDSKDRKERPELLDQRVRLEALVPWELLDQWARRGCPEREVDPDRVEFRVNVVRLETWANLDQWVHWE